MSDLSNLLGDVYGDSSNPDGPPVRHEAPAAERVPEWSEDGRLDRAFADWEPENHGGFDGAVKPAADDNALADALSAALATPAPVASVPAPAPAPAPVPVASAPVPAPAKPAWTTAPTIAPAPVAASGAPVRMWAPGDDDIFPMRGRKR